MNVIEGGRGRRTVNLVPILIAVLLLLALLVGVAVVGSQSRQDQLSVVPPATVAPSVAAPSVRSTPSASPAASPLADTVIPFPDTVLEIVPGDDAMWASVAAGGSEVPRSIYRIDPNTNAATLVLADMPVSRTSPLSPIETKGSLLLVENEANRMLRFDAATGRLLGETPLGRFPIEPKVGFGSVWSQDYEDGAVTRVDPSTGEVMATIPIPPFHGQGPRDLVAGSKLLWAITPRTDVLVGIDPARNRVAKTIELDASLHCDVGVTAGRVWVAGCDSGTPLQVFDEATGERQGSFAGIPSVGAPLHADGDVVWIPSGDQVPPFSTKIIPLDAGTLTTAGRSVVDLGVMAGSTAVAHDALWYAFGDSVYRLDLDSFPAS